MVLRRIGVIGQGQTGGRVVELAAERFDVSVFDSQNRFTVEAARRDDLEALVVFAPGAAMADLLPELMESGLPCVIGSTGFQFPGGEDYFDRTLKERGIAWIYGSNFSLGMRLAEKMIDVLSGAGELFSAPHFTLRETHHVRKKDSPSGTALSWEKRLGCPVEITSERIGDVVGIHTLTLSTPYERITLSHEALDRKIFSEGALYALDFLLNNQIYYGLNPFENVVNGTTERTLS